MLIGCRYDYFGERYWVQKKAGMEVMDSDIEGFLFWKRLRQKQVIGLLEDIPPGIYEVSTQIIEHARGKLGKAVR